MRLIHNGVKQGEEVDDLREHFLMCLHLDDNSQLFFSKLFSAYSRIHSFCPPDTISK